MRRVFAVPFWVAKMWNVVLTGNSYRYTAPARGTRCVVWRCRKQYFSRPLCLDPRQFYARYIHGEINTSSPFLHQNGALVVVRSSTSQAGCFV